MTEDVTLDTKFENGEDYPSKKRGLKSGFTIVELVVVIAVISILSAIIIPTFTGLISKAKLNANKSFVKSLNEILAVRTTGDNKNLPVETAVKYILESEIDDNNLVRNEDNLDILYDENQGQFVLLEKSKNTNKSYFTGTNFNNYTNTIERDFWKFYNKNSLKNDENYAIFIVGQDEIAEIEIHGTDFNSGTNSNISKVSYYGDSKSTSERPIEITTNGGVLFVDGENDAVEHFGIAESIEIKAVAQNSYYENGEADIISISKGHLVLNENSNVGTVFLNQKETSENTEFDEIKITIKDNHNIPEFKCNEIIVSDEEIKIATFVDGETESEYDLMIYQNGTPSLDAKGEDSKTVNAIISSIKNDIDKIEIVKNRDSDEPTTISDDDQTDYSEYVKIYTISDWTSIFKKGANLFDIKIVLENDIDFANVKIKNLTIQDMIIDGNNHKIMNVTSSIFGKSTSFAGNFEIKDLVIGNANIEEEPIFISNANACDIEFKNTEIRKSSFTDTSAFINIVNMPAIVTFTNCKIIDCEIIAKKVPCTGFVTCLNDGELVFTNCEITSTNFVAESIEIEVFGFVGETTDATKITKTNSKTASTCTYNGINIL